MAHEASLKCSLLWPERGCTAPAVETHCETYRAFCLAVITARATESPTVAYDPQISKPELMRRTKWGKKDRKTSKLGTEHRGVKGPAHGYAGLWQEPETQRGSPKSCN